MYGITVTVEEIENSLSIKWEDVKEYYIKWHAMFITMNSGEVHEYCLPEIELPEIARKYPDEVEEYEEEE
ncbi:MAG: hypothetical protein FJ361_09745 [Gemmatimonadetes bacterium]|nr:hypothetical protein [Gemmatimonadota bacterium]